MSDHPREEPKKKIIIDEDWKSRVQAEKEALRRKKQEEQAPTAAGQAEPRADAPLPPASLEVLAGSLGLEAMMAMGLVPDPSTGKPVIHLDLARHFIDLIAMLEEKTEGNRTPEETQTLTGLLHELRMGYLTVQQRQAGS